MIQAGTMGQQEAAGSREAHLDILRSNRGFDEPSLWIDYARKNCFEKVPALQLSLCPDCASPAYKRIGQYLYYSNLIHLNQCGRCSLVYSDVLLNENTLRIHFDRAYKDEDYFEKSRRAIYLQITKIIGAKAPRGSTVLDVGGAKGHLGKILRHYRPDLLITINDLSAVACDYAKSRFRFDTVCSSFSELAGRGRAYDFVLLIDVLYYERSLGTAWTALSQSAARGIIMRTPNRYSLIRLVKCPEKNLVKEKRNERRWIRWLSLTLSISTFLNAAI